MSVRSREYHARFEASPLERRFVFLSASFRVFLRGRFRALYFSLESRGLSTRDVLRFLQVCLECPQPIRQTGNFC